jgi:hypothetical protein
VTVYRFALWGPSEAWRNGHQWGAPLHIWKKRFPEKVRELGPPLRVWDHDTEKLRENDDV